MSLLLSISVFKAKFHHLYLNSFYYKLYNAITFTTQCPLPYIHDNQCITQLPLNKTSKLWEKSNGV